MTPQEKAKQLVERFYLALPNNGSQTGINNVHSRWEEGKQCAKMAVDEIIKSNPTSQRSDPFLGNRTYENVSYWNDVQQEIEKI
jgi:hypothetical protein